MNESQREKAFPIHIELGRTMGVPVPDEATSKPSKEKFYPTIFVSDVEGLEQLPKEGCILIDYKRRSLSVREENGKVTASVELEIRTMCLPEEYGEEDADEVVESLTKKAFSKKDDDDDDEDDND